MTAEDTHRAPRIATTCRHRPDAAGAGAPACGPGRFGFFQAVRLLYSANGFDGRGTGSRPGPLRFTTPASLAFPPSELHSIESPATAIPACA
jgi:predicted component of type VI protein secretion system